MTSSKTEYYAKSAGYYAKKAADTGLAHFAVVAAASLALPWMAWESSITPDEIDINGNDNAQVVMAELTEQKDDLLSLVQTYDKLVDDKAAYEQLGQRDNALAIADDIAQAEYDLQDNSKAFFANFYTNGDNEGLAISEVDAKELMQEFDEKDGDFDWSQIDEAIPNLIAHAAHAAHLDESRAKVNIDDDASLETRFNKAQSIAADATDEAGGEAFIVFLALLLGTWLPGVIAHGFYGGLRDEVLWNARKPEKPKPKPSH